MIDNIPLMELCKYTLRQSLSDTGEYPPLYPAQQLLEVINGTN